MEQGAGRGIRNVVMSPGAMVDRVPAASTDTSFEPAELADEFRVIKQSGLAGVDEREKVAIEDALRLSRGFVSNAVLAELLSRPFARVSVAGHRRHAIS